MPNSTPQFLAQLHVSTFYSSLTEEQKSTLDAGYANADEATLNNAFAELQKIEAGLVSAETDAQRQIRLAAQAVDIYKDMQALKKLDLTEREKQDEATSARLADDLINGINKEPPKKKKFLFF